MDIQDVEKRKSVRFKDKNGNNGSPVEFYYMNGEWVSELEYHRREFAVLVKKKIEARKGEQSGLPRL